MYIKKANRRISVRLFVLSGAESRSDEIFAFRAEHAPPQLAIGRVFCDQRAKLIPLSIGHRTAVGNSPYKRFKPGAGLKRRAFGRAVKINIEVDLEFSDIVLESGNLFVQCCRIVIVLPAVAKGGVRIESHILGWSDGK